MEPLCTDEDKILFWIATVFHHFSIIELCLSLIVYHDYWKITFLTIAISYIIELEVRLFILLFFLFGFGSQMVSVEMILTGIKDTWHFLVLHWQYRIGTIVSVRTLGFLLGIPCTTQSGMYVLQLMDHYSARFSVLIIAVVECFVINWIYGADRMYSHIEKMVGKRVPQFWKLCWKFILPMLILVFAFIRYKPVEYGARAYPA